MGFAVIACFRTEEKATHAQIRVKNGSVNEVLLYNISAVQVTNKSCSFMASLATKRAEILLTAKP
jgi:hypothetical protein